MAIQDEEPWNGFADDSAIYNTGSEDEAEAGNGEGEGGGIGGEGMSTMDEEEVGHGEGGADEQIHDAFDTPQLDGIWDLAGEFSKPNSYVIKRVDVYRGH